MLASHVKTYTLTDHIREKAMWVGSRRPLKIANLAGASPDGRVVPILNNHTPAALGCINEILVNAVDHAVECQVLNKPPVTRIDLTYDEAGVFTCRNDGPCIQLQSHAEFSREKGRPVLTPEVVFCYPLSGTNMTKADDSIKGGVNGLGGKIANLNSALFVVSIQDGVAAYRLVCRDCMRTIEPPQHGAAPDAQIFTEVSMYLDYAGLGYGQLTTDRRTEFELWLRLRAMQCAAYLGGRVQVVFNGQPMGVRNAHELAICYLSHYAPKTASEALLITTSLKSTDPKFKQYPWDVALVVSPEIKSFKSVTIVNGVPTSSGAHISRIRKMIAEDGTKDVRKMLEDRNISIADATTNVFVIILAPIPGADWSGQSKDQLSYNESDLQSFSFSRDFIKQLVPMLTSMVMTKLGKKEKKNNTRKKIDARRYMPALTLGQSATLCAVEGDSAKAMFVDGLGFGNTKTGQPSMRNYGIVTLNGVPMNAYRNIVKIPTAGGGTQIIRKQCLIDNVTYQTFEQAMGLVHGCTYENPLDLASLNYGQIVVCVDQDLDGAGKILGLFVTYLYTFWPALFRHGIVRWFMTPVIRVFPKGSNTAVAEFYHDSVFKEWWAPADAETRKKFQVTYYKGLGSHDSPDVERMFANFSEMCVRISADEQTQPLIDIYYGEAASERKKLLSTPAADVTAAEFAQLLAARVVTCAWLFNTYSKAYKLDALMRQIPHIIDGLNLAKRKSLYGAEMFFENRSEKVKVNTLAGYIICNCAYEHGEDPLNHSLQGGAQTFNGARIHPLYIGYGQFGSRLEGGSDASAARYVSIALNKKFTSKLFPAADRPLLEYVEQEGEEVEPRYYVPILPYVLLDHGNNPSEGWRYASWARDIRHVAQAVVNCIGSDFNPADERHMGWLQQQPLPLCIQGYSDRLKFGVRNGKMHTFGHYDYDTHACEFIITELPMRVWNSSYIKMLTEHEFRSTVIKSVKDLSNNTNINIRVKLKGPASLEEIYKKYSKCDDPYREFLGLHASLQPFLNYINTDGSVIGMEGEEYYRVIAEWYPVRKAYYAHRLEREKALMELHIAMEEEVLRFIPLAAVLDFNKKTDRASAIAVLEEHQFKPFNSGALRRPGKGRAEAVRRKVMDCAANRYDYLFDLKQGDLTQCAVQKRQARLEERRQKLDALNAKLAERPFAGASLWVQEIHALVDATEKAHAKGGWKNM